MEDTIKELEARLAGHRTRMASLRLGLRMARDVADRAQADYDNEWMNGENIRERIRRLTAKSK